MFKIVKLDYNYCNYLRQFDNKVAYNSGLKELRPFIGVLFSVSNFKYFAPLSSPKPKHKKMTNSEDFIKIGNGELGAINFNNMIPVKEGNYEVYDLYSKVIDKKEIQYRFLLKSQLMWLNRNSKLIRNKAYRLYGDYVNNKLPKNIKSRCCNFKLLEEKCEEYSYVIN